MKLTYLWIALLSLAACQSKVVPVSQRNMPGIEKPGTPFHGRGPQSPKQELFVEEKNIEIQEVAQPNETGSLFNVDDQRNYLFLTHPPLRVGQFVSLKVVPTTKKAENKPADPNAKPDPAAQSDDAFVKEMLAQLPQLDAGEENPQLLSNISFRIDQILDNGDALISYQRTSKNAADSKDVFVKGRLPYSALQNYDNLTTQQVQDVRWTDSLDGQLTERRSPSWEDEYSLRLSGFSEAKSLYARQIEDKRKQLKGVRDRLNNELVSFGKERKRMAEERDANMKAKADAETKLAEAEKTMSEQKDALTSYQEKEKEAEAKLAEEDAKTEKKDDKAAAAKPATPAKK